MQEFRGGASRSPADPLRPVVAGPEARHAGGPVVASDIFAKLGDIKGVCIEPTTV